jgi:hypothetical protein
VWSHVIRANHEQEISANTDATCWRGKRRERSARIDVRTVTWRNASVSSDPSGAADAPDSAPGPLLLGPPVRSMTVDWTRPGSVYQVQNVCVRVRRALS